MSCTPRRKKLHGKAEASFRFGFGRYLSICRCLEEASIFHNYERMKEPMLIACLALLLAGFNLAAGAGSPLADAVEKSDRAAALARLKKHTDINAAQPDGMTALHWAAYEDDL